MIRDYSKTRVKWTRHAFAEATEDNFKTNELEGSFLRVVEFPELNGKKRRGIVRLGSRYCTLIYVLTGQGIVVITCWESNPTDISEYNNVVKSR